MIYYVGFEVTVRFNLDNMVGFGVRIKHSGTATG